MANGNGTDPTQPDSTIRENARQFLSEKGLLAQPDDSLRQRAREFLQQRQPRTNEQDLRQRARSFLQSRQQPQVRPEEGFGQADTDVPEPDQEQREQIKKDLDRRIEVLQRREHQLTEQVQGLRDEATIRDFPRLITGPITEDITRVVKPELMVRADSLASERDQLRKQRIALLNEKDELLDEEKGIFGQALDALTQTNLFISTIPPAINLIEQGELVTQLERIDSGDLKVPAFQPSVPFGGLGPDPSGQLHLLSSYQSMNAEQRKEYKRNLGIEMVEKAGEIDNILEKMSQIEADPLVEAMLSAKTNEEGLEIFMQAPLENIMSFGFASLPYTVVSLIGGAIGGVTTGTPLGAAAGVGVGSGAMEYFADMTGRVLAEAQQRTGLTADDIIAELEKNGFDTSEVTKESLFVGKHSHLIPELLKKSGKESDFKSALLDVVNDRAAIEKFHRQSALKGVGVAAGDALGTFIPTHTITSQLFRNAASGSVKAAKIASSVAAGLVIDASSGALGETMGQMMADGELKPGEIQAEFWGELFGAPFQISTTVGSTILGSRREARFREDIKAIAKRSQARSQQQPTEGRPFEYIQLTETPKGPVEQTAYSWVINNLGDMTANYTGLINREFSGASRSQVVSADEAKKAIIGYNVNRSGDYHEPASGFAKLWYQELLADESTADMPVSIMSGGSGSGKTSILRRLRNLDDFAAVYDTNLNSFNSAKRKIEQALESGRQVEIFHVYRDPLEAFQNGVMRRVKGEGQGAGRIVPVEAHIATHLGARETLIQLEREYADNPNVTIDVIDNSRGKGEEALVANSSELPDIELTEETLREALTQQVNNALENQQINQKQADTFFGQDRSQTQGARPQDRQGSGQNIAQSSSQRFVIPPLRAVESGQISGQQLQNAIATLRQQQDIELPSDNNFLTRIAKRIWPFSPATKTQAESSAQSLLRQRSGEIGVGQLQSFAFTNEIKQRHSETELQAITFLLEKTNAPDRIANRDAIQALIDSPTEQMEQTVGQVRAYLDEAHQFLMENLGEDLGFIEDYVPHIWDIPRNRMEEVVNWFVTENPATKKRIIPTIKAGIDQMGLTPRTTSITRLLSIYDEFKTKTVANIQFVEGLLEMTDEYGEPLVKRVDQAPPNWPEVDHPVLRRGLAIGNNDEQVVILKVPVKVHPEIASAVEAVLGDPFSGRAIQGLMMINGFLKKAWLTISFFHHVALSEVGLVTPGLAGKTAKIAASFLNVPRLYKRISEGDYEYLQNLDIAKDGVRHGLQIGAISDVHRDQITQALETLENRFADGPLRLFRKGATALRKGNEIWDKALWDYMHNTLKIQGYEIMVAYLTRKSPNADPEIIKLEAAQQVNDTFGGQNWDLLLKSPKWKQVMHLLLLSPDWTWSTMRQATSVLGLGSATKTPTGRALRKKMGRGFWLRATIYFMGGMNLLNFMLTKGKYGDGRFMWENDPGEKTNLEICNYPDGNKKYLRWGKQFRELFEFIAHPVEKMASKVSPIIQEGVKQVTGQTLTGFPTEFQGQDFWESILPEKGNLLPDRFEEIARSPIPFSLRNQIRDGSFEPLNLAFPISRGLTPFGARQFFEQAINDRDISYISEIARRASENNLNPEELFDQTVARMLSDRKRELRKQYGVREFDQLPFSVRRGYQRWEQQVKTYQKRVEFSVQRWSAARR